MKPSYTDTVMAMVAEESQRIVENIEPNSEPQAMTSIWIPVDLKQELALKRLVKQEPYYEVIRRLLHPAPTKLAPKSKRLSK